MKVLVVRHAISEANNRNNVDTMAFASTEAPLMDIGVEQANILSQKLVKSFNVDLSERVAVSGLFRTQQTAKEAGFSKTIIYQSLNEVEHNLPLGELRESLNNNILPKQAVDQAELILDNPPNESIWISHGLVIAGLCKALCVYQEQTLIPKFCEIRELDI